MGTRLKAIVPFVNVAPGATVALPHGLNVNGNPVIPDELQASVGGFTVALIGLNISVTNQNPAAASIDVLAEHWHTLERDFGDAADLNLTPQPFILTPAGAGGGNPVNIEEEGALVGVRPTLNFIGPAVTAVDNPGANRVDITIAESGLATHFDPGTVAAPGLFVTGDVDTGLYQPAVNQVAVAAGGVQAALFTAQGIAIPVGAVATPGLSFPGDVDTGIYQLAGNRMGFAAGAALKFTAETQGLGVVTTGVVGAPSIFWLGDTDTGLYPSAANEVAIAAGGTLAATFRAQGIAFRVGAVATPSLFVDGDANTGIYSPAAEQIGIACAGVARAIVDNTAVADEASLLLSFAGAAAKRLSQGAADSGGAGFRQVVVPN